jgi:hypothetical protein
MRRLLTILATRIVGMTLFATVDLQGRIHAGGSGLAHFSGGGFLEGRLAAGVIIVKGNPARHPADHPPGCQDRHDRIPHQGSEGQVLRFDLFDLAVRNRTVKDLDHRVFLDRVDQALGLLEVRVDKGLIRRPDDAVGLSAAGTLLVAMTADLEVPDREDVFYAIKYVADDLEVDINRVLDPESSSVVTDRDRRELELSQFAIFDLTDAAPAVYLQAGLGRCLWVA